MNSEFPIDDMLTVLAALLDDDMPKMLAEVFEVPEEDMLSDAKEMRENNPITQRLLVLYAKGKISLDAYMWIAPRCEEDRRAGHLSKMLAYDFISQFLTDPTEALLSFFPMGSSRSPVHQIDRPLLVELWDLVHAGSDAVYDRMRQSGHGVLGWTLQRQGTDKLAPDDAPGGLRSMYDVVAYCLIMSRDHVSNLVDFETQYHLLSADARTYLQALLRQACLTPDERTGRANRLRHCGLHGVASLFQF